LQRIDRTTSLQDFYSTEINNNKLKTTITALILASTHHISMVVLNTHS